MDRDKYIKSKNKIFDLIKENTSYEYDNKYLKHSAFINTVSHLTKTPSKLTIVTTNYDTLLEDAADSIGYTVMDGFRFLIDHILIAICLNGICKRYRKC